MQHPLQIIKCILLIMRLTLCLMCRQLSLQMTHLTSYVSKVSQCDMKTGKRRATVKL